MSFARLIGHAAVVNAFNDLLNQWAGDPDWAIGTNVEYGRFLELGTRKMPAYPWLAPAVKDVVRSDAERILMTSESVEEAMQRLSLQIERQATINATAGRSGRSRGTHPEHPMRQTGNLAGSIKAVRL